METDKVEFKMVIVNDDCAELNAAAVEGFQFVEWVPDWHPPHALVARRTPDPEKERSAKKQLVDMLGTVGQVCAVAIASIQGAGCEGLGSELDELEPKSPPVQ